MELTEADIRDIREQGDLRTFLRERQAEATAANEHHRRLVLAHPDLAEQLTHQPIALGRPDCWTGYLGSERLPDGTPNRSPVRTQLAALVAEAERRAS